jgi:hypothetical protein
MGATGLSRRSALFLIIPPTKEDKCGRSIMEATGLNQHATIFLTIPTKKQMFAPFIMEATIDRERDRDRVNQKNRPRLESDVDATQFGFAAS